MPHLLQLVMTWSLMVVTAFLKYGYKLFAVEHSCHVLFGKDLLHTYALARGSLENRYQRYYNEYLCHVVLAASLILG